MVELRGVTEDEAEIRLDRWLRRHFPGLKQGAIEKLCRTGQVRVDGKRVEAATRLAPGQSIRIPPMPSTATQEQPREVDPRLRAEMEEMVLYRDPLVLVLNKPYGLPVQGGPGITRHLDGMLPALAEGGDRPRLVHRLDRDTTGVLVVARTAGSAAKLAAAFRGRTIEKTYWAVVVGRPSPSEGRIDRALVRVNGDRGERTDIAIPNDENAARAITDFRTLDHASNKLAWLEMQPLTGRTHQLRVHSSAINTPILGDWKYGDHVSQPEGMGDKLHLHARRLRFPHPGGGMLEVTAPLPPHMRETFQTLGFEAPPVTPPRRN